MWWLDDLGELVPLVLLPLPVALALYLLLATDRRSLEGVWGELRIRVLGPIAAWSLLFFVTLAVARPTLGGNYQARLFTVGGLAEEFSGIVSVATGWNGEVRIGGTLDPSSGEACPLRLGSETSAVRRQRLKLVVRFGDRDLGHIEAPVAGLGEQIVQFFYWLPLSQDKSAGTRGMLELERIGPSPVWIAAAIVLGPLLFLLLGRLVFGARNPWTGLALSLYLPLLALLGGVGHLLYSAPKHPLPSPGPASHDLAGVWSFALKPGPGDFPFWGRVEVEQPGRRFSIRGTLRREKSEDAPTTPWETLVGVTTEDGQVFFEYWVGATNTGGLAYGQLDDEVADTWKVKFFDNLTTPVRDAGKIAFRRMEAGE